MTIAFRQNITTWGNNTAGPVTSGANTVTGGDTVLVGNIDGAATGHTLVYSGSVNNPVSAITVNDATNGNTLGMGAVLSATGGSQTFTVNSSPGGDAVSGVAIEYSGVSSAVYNSNGPVIGTTAPIGVATVVPVGSILVALLVQTHGVGGTPAGQVSGGVTPTDRQVSTWATGAAYAISEWVGTGSTVTPTWSAVSSNYVVIQVLLSSQSVYTPFTQTQFFSKRKVIQR